MEVKPDSKIEFREAIHKKLLKRMEILQEKLL